MPSLLKLSKKNTKTHHIKIRPQLCNKCP